MRTRSQVLAPLFLGFLWFLPAVGSTQEMGSRHFESRARAEREAITNVQTIVGAPDTTFSRPPSGGFWPASFVAL